MTKEEWSYVEKQLKSGFIVRLNIDGYNVSLRLERVGLYKLGIMVYINEVFKGDCLKECEISRRFLPKHSKRVFTKRELKGFPRIKRSEMKKKKYEYYGFYWDSFNYMKRAFICNNNNIELIKE